MPGVGALYEPELGVIKDLALYVKDVSPMDKDEVVPSPIGMQAKGDEVLYLKYFPREKLPSTQDDIFKVLFKERAKWNFDHLAPYIEDIVKKSSFKTVQELLVKYAKVSPRDEDDEDGVITISQSSGTTMSLLGVHVVHDSKTIHSNGYVHV